MSNGGEMLMKNPQEVLCNEAMASAPGQVFLWENNSPSKSWYMSMSLYPLLIYSGLLIEFHLVPTFG